MTDLLLDLVKDRLVRSEKLAVLGQLAGGVGISEENMAKPFEPLFITATKMWRAELT
jgi:hypothetical protein